jgi:hypothetical protein
MRHCGASPYWSSTGAVDFRLARLLKWLRIEAIADALADFLFIRQAPRRLLRQKQRLAHTGGISPYLVPLSLLIGCERHKRVICLVTLLK